MRSDLYLGYATFPSEDLAKTTARVLVAEKLIACANILPSHTAIYEWQGRIHQDSECAVIFKTSKAKRAALKERIRGIHPNQIPALVFVKIEDGLPDFLNWIYGQTL